MVEDTSAGQEGLDSPECSAVGHDRPPPSIVEYGQQLGFWVRGLIEHPDRHAQDLVLYKRLVVLSVLLFCFFLKRAFKITFLEDHISEYAELLKTLKLLMSPTRCLHKEL